MNSDRRHDSAAVGAVFDEKGSLSAAFFVVEAIWAASCSHRMCEGIG
jgi:hypothetical protein